MTHKIFVGYAKGDEAGAAEVFNALRRIKGVTPYIPGLLETADENLPIKIRNGLQESDLAVFLITFNSTNTIWLNQEIGYASARQIPIISIVEKGIDVRGFLEKKEYMVFQRADFGHNVYQLISKIREEFARLGDPLTLFQVTCPSCDTMYLEPLPSKNIVDEAVERRQHLRYQCPSCSHHFLVDPKTLDVKVDS